MGKFLYMVEYMGQGIQKYVKENLWKAIFKKFKVACSVIISLQIFERLPQMGPFLNHLSRGNCNPYIPLFSPRKGIRNRIKYRIFVFLQVCDFRKLDQNNNVLKLL